MIVSNNNNNLLNILLPNDNKVLKEVLKDADAKTLESLNKGTINVNDVLKNLFNDLKSGEKNLSTIENLLKNSNTFKELGNFPKSISTLLEKLDPSLQKYKPILETFSKDISDLDANTLKDLVNKSGVFLESKALSLANGNSTIPKSLENILNQVKSILNDIPSIESKNLSNLIDKIVQNANQNLSSQQLNSDIKALISGLQNLSKNIDNKQLNNLLSLTNSLKTISDDAQLVESKMQNFNTNSIDALQNKESILNKTLNTLEQLKNELQTGSNIPNKETLLKQIDTLLQSKDLFSNNSSQVEVKNLLNQLSDQLQSKNLTILSSSIENLASNLKNQSEAITNLENKILQNQDIQIPKADLTKDIQQTLLSLKNELSNINVADTKLINQIIDKLLNIQNLFSKVELPADFKALQQSNMSANFQSNFASNINELVLNLKESIVNLSTNPENLNLHNSIFKNIEKLENIANNLLQPLSPNDKQINANNLQHDMKTVLLQMQDDLQGKTDTNSQELSKQVDKMISHIEYHQLLSIVSNSNNVYMPFIWDMLDDGNISMKKVDEEKFYCEINLSLKEFGQTQLLLALYDKNKLDLTVYVSKESFKQSFRENLTKLKQGLNLANLIPVNIKIIDIKPVVNNSDTKTNTNPYGQSQDFNSGFNIRV